jgi:1,4-alpha-glucan branching enzyme
VKRRALDQAAREVMLAQASDWAFIMKTGTTVPYAKKRTVEHVTRFTQIYEALMNDSVDEKWLAEVERRDNLFPEMNYGVYAT